MTTLLRLAKTELFKLLKHRLTWLLLATLLIIVGLRLRGLRVRARNGLDIVGPVDEYMRAQMDAWPQWPGSAAVLIAQDGQVLVRRGYGLADRETNAPVTPDTVFPIASMSKQFTAMAIMQLAEAGRLDVRAPVGVYVPGLPYGDRVTIHHLLTHSSGIPNALTGVPLTLEFEPGSRASYSNSGYFLLGQVIEAASGQSYADYIRTRIFEPLGMRRSGFGPSSLAGLENAVTGYVRSADGPVTVSFPPGEVPGAAGGLYSTINDLYLWDRALSANTLARAETMAQIWTPYQNMGDNRVGYGWMMGQIGGHEAILHGGTMQGFSGEIVRLAEVAPFRPQVTVIVLSNAAWLPINRIVEDLVSIVYGEFYDLPVRHEKPIIGLSPDVFDAYVGVYDHLELNMTLTAYREQDRFFVHVDSSQGEMTMELYPYSETQFFADYGDTEVRFAADEASGEVNQLIVAANGVDMSSAWRRGSPGAPERQVDVDSLSAQKLGAILAPAAEPQPGDYRRAAIFPGAFECLYRSYDWLLIALILLGIAFVGNEFSWGTIRTVLARGVPRARLVLAKWIALLAVATIGLLAMWLLCGLYGLWSLHRLTGSLDLGFVSSMTWLEQGTAFGRAWLMTLLLTATIVATYIGVGKAGPAFALLFLLFFLSFLAYILLSVGLGFLFAIPDFDPAAFGSTFWAKLPVLIPHYDIRQVLYWGNPGKLAELDTWVRLIADILALPSNPWISVMLLFIYGSLPLLGAISTFKQREMTP
ncbi:MAG: serine hydrolase [Anaerolineae bacterium]|nr:serine hydrolase [Anaerolineae bacterium]